MAKNRNFELVQDLIIKAHNPNVKATFRDDIADGETPEEWGDNAERALKNLMLVKDTDNADTTIIKLLLALMYRLDKVENDLSSTGNYFQPWADKEQRPMVQVQLIERSDRQATIEKRARYIHEFSFRWKEKETNEITRENIDQLRGRINAHFPNSYKFNAGKIKCTYYNPADGFRSIIHAANASEAKELIRKLCKVNQTEYDDEYFTLKGPVATGQIKQKKIRYKGELVNTNNRKYADVECVPYRAYLYPGSGLKTELIAVL